ncbi:MAG: hypothetical protein A2X94_08480 [Bdellovibrionales bacterium GWB1_55_8]|nr:MAG: hypothetical protein A2X94_08480 [Bdellovibrionales bacterium GWB1_55_8]
MDLQTIRLARERLAPYLSPSPLIPITALGNNLQQSLHLKLETQQPTGSFKVRPALNGMLANLGEARARGVLASSSGNFAQAVAHSANLLGCHARIVMTSNTAPLKIERTRALGAEVTLCEPTFKDRWDTTYRLQKETGRVLLHPYDSPETIAGNGTIGLELDEQLPPGKLRVYVPVSGGGLLAGIAAAIKNLRPDAIVLGVQPSVNASMKRSLDSGTPVRVPAFQSIADALVALEPGATAFSIVKRYVDDILLVSEDEIREATKHLLFEQKLLVEPAGAVPFAAGLKAARSRPEAAICILSGANISAEVLSATITR